MHAYVYREKDRIEKRREQESVVLCLSRLLSLTDAVVAGREVDSRLRAVGAEALDCQGLDVHLEEEEGYEDLSHGRERRERVRTGNSFGKKTREKVGYKEEKKETERSRKSRKPAVRKEGKKAAGSRTDDGENDETPQTSSFRRVLSDQVEMPQEKRSVFIPFYV